MKYLEILIFILFFTGTILLHFEYILYMPPKADFIMANVAQVSGVANGPLVIMMLLN